MRLKILSLDKSKRYLAYALGEILLVVVGILIALEVDTMRQKSVERKLEKEYLERFLLDLEKDLSIVDYVEETLDFKAQNLRKVRSYMDDPTVLMDDSVMKALQFSRILGVEIPNVRLTGTFQELVSSGHLRLIKNVALRNTIVNYYSAWDHNSDRIKGFQSDYPSLIFQITDRNDFFEGQSLYRDKPFNELLSNLEIKSLFYRLFMQEVNYMTFVEGIMESNRTRLERAMDEIEEELQRLNKQSLPEASS